MKLLPNRYSDAVAEAQAGRGPELPTLVLPQEAVYEPIRRPGLDAYRLMLEAAVVAVELKRRDVPFDRKVSIDDPVAGTELGAWNLNPFPDHSQFNLTREGQPNGTVNRVHLEPAMLAETGRVLFAFHGLHHDTGPDLPPEPIVALRALGEGTAEIEQVRYGLANLILKHELAPRI